MWKRLLVKYPLFLLDFNENWIFSTYFRKSSNSKFYQNPSSGRWVIPYGQDGRTDIRKLGVAFRNFANARRKRDSKCEKCEDINENNLCDNNRPGDSDNATCRQRFSLWAIWTRWRMMILILVMEPLGLQWQKSFQELYLWLVHQETEVQYVKVRVKAVPLQAWTGPWEIR
jgi:hypothetical protein